MVREAILAREGPGVLKVQKVRKGRRALKGNQAIQVPKASQVLAVYKVPRVRPAL